MSRSCLILTKVSGVSFERLAASLCPSFLQQPASFLHRFLAEARRTPQSLPSAIHSPIMASSSNPSAHPSYGRTQQPFLPPSQPSSSSSSSKAAMPASASPFSDPTLLFYFDLSSDKVTAFRREIEVSRRSKEEAGREGGVMSSTLLLLLPVCSQAHPQLIPCFHSRIRLILPPEAALSHRPTSSNEPRTSSSPRTAPTRTSLFGRFLRLNGS